MNDNGEVVVVIDYCSGSIKAGFSGENVPHRYVIPVVRRQRAPQQRVGMGTERVYVGEEALAQKDGTELRFPIERGLVTNWDDMETVWHHTFYVELRIDPEEHPLLMTEPPLNPVANRQKMIQILFETFNIQAMYVTIRQYLSLLDAGSMTGLVLSSGDGTTCSVPIYMGHPLLHAALRVNLAGQELTEYLMKLLVNRGFSISQGSGRKVVKEMKETVCYVASDYEKELKTSTESSPFEIAYALPDGAEIILNSERFRCPEALFQPGLLGMSSCGVQHMVHQSIIQCDVDARADLFGNVVLAGGSTMFDGFAERLNKALAALSSTHINVVSRPERSFSAWSGGSAFAASQRFKDVWLDRRTYGKFGPASMHVDY